MEPIVLHNAADMIAVARLKQDVQQTKAEDVEGVTWMTGLQSNEAKKVTLSPDGRFLAVTKETDVELWDANQKRVMHCWPAGFPGQLCWRDTERLVYIDNQNQLVECRVDGTRIVICSTANQISRVACSNDDQVAFSVSEETYRVKLLDGSNIYESKKYIRALAWSLDSTLLAIAHDTDVCIYDVANRTKKQQFEVDFNIEEIFFPENIYRLVLIGWELRRGGEVPVLMNNHLVDVINLGPPGLNIISVIKRVKLADTDQFDCAFYELNDSSVAAVTEHCEFYFQSAGAQLKMYARRGRPLFCMEHHHHNIVSVTANAKTKTVVTLDDQRNIIFWYWSEAIVDG